MTHIPTSNDRDDNLRMAAMFQRVAAADHKRAAMRVVDARVNKGKRRAELLSDAAAFQLLARDNHRRAVIFMAAAAE